jgi:hypothetical protein
LGVDGLPAPLLPNEHAGPATLLINRPLLVLPFGGGAIGHDGGIPVAADFNIIYNQRVEFHAAGLAVLQVLRGSQGCRVGGNECSLCAGRVLGKRCGFDKGRIEVCDQLRQLPFVADRIA